LANGRENSLLYGDLDEEIYMSLPESDEDYGNFDCLRLKKAIYGLKQASQQWNFKFGTEVRSMGFMVSNHDPCLYLKNEKERTVMIMLYVDDVIITGNCVNLQNEVRKQLAARFEMTDLGECKFVLGIEIMRPKNWNGVILCQRRYVQDILEKFGMTDCKYVKSPVDMSTKLSGEHSPKEKVEIEEMQSIPYRQAVGALMYLMVASRPDIAYAVGMVSRFMENPGKLHWIAVKRIFKYLKGTTDFGLRYSHGSTLNLEAYCDADWAGDVNDRKSTSGYLFKLAGGPIS